MTFGVLLRDPVERTAFLDRYHFYTTETLPHEQTIISAILGMPTGRDSWRFCRGVRCRGCQRELASLDFFASALVHHGLTFLKEKCVNPVLNDKEAAAIDILIPGTRQGAFGYSCITCGQVESFPNHGACAAYIYRYPVYQASEAGEPRISVRMNRTWYDRLFKEAALLARYPCEAD